MELISIDEKSRPAGRLAFASRAAFCVGKSDCRKRGVDGAGFSPHRVTPPYASPALV